MSIKKTTGASVAGAALLLSSLAPAAQAAEVDTTPPDLVSFRLSTPIVDAREGGTVTATARITDETCLDGDGPRLRMRTAAGDPYGDPRLATRVSGDCADGVYETSFPISAAELGDQPFGSWNVTVQPLSDTLGNSAGPGHPGFNGTRSFEYGASPDAVADLTVTDAHTRGISASWSAPDDNGFSVLEYVVRIKDTAGAVVLLESVSGTSVDGLPVSLAAGQNYSFEVTAHNMIGGTETTTTSFTAQAAPGTPAPGDSPFVDITPATTFYKEMAWMAETGISGGWSTEAGKEYRPHVAVDRDVMAAFLYRLAGAPASTPPAESPFADVTPATTFYQEMAWMADAGISGGWATDAGKEYRPHTAVDRDVMAAFLYRLAGSPEYTAPPVSPFADITPETTFYKEMAWMAETGISGGWSTDAGKEYRPHVAVDRDVMAAFLYRLRGVL